jgi:ABC-type branched-subunit amino acid transport system substrate-binding protein
VRESGLDLPLLTGSGSFQDPVYWTSTKGAIAGGYTWLSTDIQSPAPELKVFLDAFRAKFGQQASTNNVHGADAVFTMVQALKLAGRPDRDAVRDALGHIDFVTPIGTHIKFDNPPSGDNATPTVVPVQVTGPGTYVRI